VCKKSSKGGGFEVGGNPFDIEGEKNHGFSLARAFMPLSTPISDGECDETTECNEEFPSLLRALSVLIGECSKPCPLDQV
jgi:hypothetical protein